jgi:hypothetical protein
MKKLLLSSALLGGILGAEAQEIFRADFEAPSYTLGDFTGAQDTSDPAKTNIYFAQNGFKFDAGTTGLTTANYQVEAGIGSNTTNVFSLTGWPMTPGDASKRNSLFIPFANQWSGAGKIRQDGNDVLQLDFDVYMPPTTTSRDYLYVTIANNVNSTSPNYSYAFTSAIVPRSSTAMRLLTYPGNSIVTATAANANPTKSTWQHVTITYDTVSNEVKSQFAGKITTAASQLIIPAYLELALATDPATVTIPSTKIRIDNIVITATPTSTLGSKEIYRENNDVAVYVTNNKQLEVAAKVEVTALEIYDLSGRLLTENKNSNSIDVSALQNGTYVAKYSDKKQTYSKRFIK